MKLGNTSVCVVTTLARLTCVWSWLSQTDRTYRCFKSRQEQSLEAALPLLAKYRDHRVVDSAFAELAEHWDGYLQAVQVETPDLHELVLNVHNPTSVLQKLVIYFSVPAWLWRTWHRFHDSSQDTRWACSLICQKRRRFVSAYYRCKTSMVLQCAVPSLQPWKRTRVTHVKRKIVGLLRRRSSVDHLLPSSICEEGRQC
ncbi:hypothetical protein OK016_28950 [Vibrio chagasii]|nr:hypothetical protein [Vibrio chagasii]